EDLRDAARSVPADRILAETDSPYLAPQPVRGKRNEPAYVVHTVASLAETRREDLAELGSRIDENAAAAFGLTGAAARRRSSASTSSSTRTSSASSDGSRSWRRATSFWRSVLVSAS